MYLCWEARAGINGRKPHLVIPHMDRGGAFALALNPAWKIHPTEMSDVLHACLL